MKNDQVIKKDMFNNPEIDPITKEKIMIQKKLICVQARDLHILMKKPVAEGGFEEAFGDNDRFLRLVSCLRRRRDTW